MPPERWRLFVAVPLPDELRRSLAAQLEELRVTAPRGVRWLDPASWHVTLVFLGDTEPARVPELISALTVVAEQHAPFDARTGRLGAFPTPAKARAVWIGVDGRAELEQLAGAVARAVGVVPDEPFRGHITIARLRRPVDVTAWMHRFQPIDARLPFSELRLVRSRLGRDAATHETVATVLSPRTAAASPPGRAGRAGTARTGRKASRPARLR